MLVRDSQPLTLFWWWNGPQLSGLGLGTCSSVKPPPSSEDKVALVSSVSELNGHPM